MSASRKGCDPAKMKLIELVRDEPLLWDFRRHNYSTADKSIIWESITHEMHMAGFDEWTVDSAMKTWKNLKDYYKGVKPKPLTGSSAADVKPPTWIYFGSIQFLDTTDSSALRISSDMSDTASQQRLVEEFADLSSSASTADLRSSSADSGYNSPAQYEAAPAPDSVTDFLTPKAVKRRRVNLDESMMELSAALVSKKKKEPTMQKVDNELTGFQPSLLRLLETDQTVYQKTIKQIKRIILAAEDEIDGEL